MHRIYLDHSATTPLDPEVFRAMKPYLKGYTGNPSSVHAFGRSARAALEEARERIAGILGCRGDELVFTSGGTESDNHALRGTCVPARRSGRSHLLVSAVEHHAILHTAERLRPEGFDAEIVPVDQYGRVNPDDVKSRIRPSTALVSVMHANNEVGTIQPIRQIAEFAKAAGALVHTDAVQSFGKVSVKPNELSVDLLSLSAHKFYGPRGIGLLYIRKGTAVEPLLGGGAQERNLRPGTENVASAVGMAKAMELCVRRMEKASESLAGLRNYLLSQLTSRFAGLVVNGHPTEVLPNILSVSFDSAHEALDGEALIMGLDLKGIAITSGSACTSGSLEPSHVLLAMGRDELTARATVRFSLGRQTRREDLDAAIKALVEVVEQVRTSKRA